MAVVLALSLALNVCVVGGFAYSRWFVNHFAAAPEHKLDILGERLHLTHDQRQPFEAFKQTLRDGQTALWEENEPLLEQAWGELTKDPVDPAQLQALMDQMSLHRHAFQVGAAASLVQFIKALTLEQRETLRRIVLDHHDPIGQPLRSNVGN
jgi:uncharacterized membrane protein